jgi:glyoxylase-like metal-dependent hydrolase (beta-lactamase superfamily II)
MHRFIVLLFISTLIACNSETGEQKKVATQKKDIWSQTRYESTNVDMQLIKVSEHVYYVEGSSGAPTDFDGFMSNASVVVTGKGVLIFDSLGTPSLAYLLLSKIRQLTDEPIVKLVVSHYHADHIYGLQVFKEAGAQIVAALGAKTYLESDTSDNRLKERRESLFPWVNEDTHIIVPDVYIDKKTIFTMGEVTFEITALGSTHSDGDLSIRVQPDQVLLAGDLVFMGRIPFVAGSHPQNWIKNLNALETKEIKVIIPGHGPASEDLNNAAKFTQDYLMYLHKTMRQAVDDLTPFDEAYSQANWSQYEKYPAFQANRMNAFFMYLALEAESVNE